MDPLDVLHSRILSCRLCQDAGYIERAAPVVAGQRGNRIMLIGQAPGITELEVRRPFAGRAGRELFRWMESIDIDETSFRRHVYMTAITKCFPGKARGGTGDRRPSGQEIALCRPFLDSQLTLVRPDVIMLVGGLAIDRYFPRVPLHECIGTRVDRDGVNFIPLPHPSGASRWLNVEEHRVLLRAGLQHVRDAWDRFVESQGVINEAATVVG